MAEQYRDYVPAEEKPATIGVEGGLAKDWIPPPNFNEAECRPYDATDERLPADVSPARVTPAPIPPPEEVMAARTYHCRNCDQPFETLGKLMAHRRTDHP